MLDTPLHSLSPALPFGAASEGKHPEFAPQSHHGRSSVELAGVTVKPPLQPRPPPRVRQGSTTSLPSSAGRRALCRSWPAPPRALPCVLVRRRTPTIPPPPDPPSLAAVSRHRSSPTDVEVPGPPHRRPQAPPELPPWPSSSSTESTDPAVPRLPSPSPGRGAPPRARPRHRPTLPASLWPSPVSSRSLPCGGGR